MGLREKRKRNIINQIKDIITTDNINLENTQSKEDMITALMSQFLCSRRTAIEYIKVAEFELKNEI